MWGVCVGLNDNWEGRLEDLLRQICSSCTPQTLAVFLMRECSKETGKLK